MDLSQLPHETLNQTDINRCYGLVTGKAARLLLDIGKAKSFTKSEPEQWNLTDLPLL